MLSIHAILQALDEPVNSAIKRQLADTLAALRALPKQQLAGPTTNGNGANGNGANGEGHQDGPATLLARCRELALQVEVRACDLGEERAICTALVIHSGMRAAARHGPSSAWREFELVSTTLIAFALRRCQRRCGNNCWTA